MATPRHVTQENRQRLGEIRGAVASARERLWAAMMMLDSARKNVVAAMNAADTPAQQARALAAFEQATSPIIQAAAALPEPKEVIP